MWRPTVLLTFLVNCETSLYDDEYENIEIEEMVHPHLENLWNDLWKPLIEKLKEETLVTV